MNSTLLDGAIVALAALALGRGLAGEFRVPSASERRDAIGDTARLPQKRWIEGRLKRIGAGGETRKGDK
jgi:hypothetical protein